MFLPGWGIGTIQLYFCAAYHNGHYRIYQGSNVAICLIVHTRVAGGTVLKPELARTIRLGKYIPVRFMTENHVEFSVAGARSRAFDYGQCH